MTEPEQYSITNSIHNRSRIVVNYFAVYSVEFRFNNTVRERKWIRIWNNRFASAINEHQDQ
jgi:hypothetical protein